MLRKRLSDFSMVFDALFLHVHLRLVEIFGCTNNVPFAGMTVIVVRDFMQLPPVKARPVYVEFKNYITSKICPSKH